MTTRRPSAPIPGQQSAFDDQLPARAADASDSPVQARIDWEHIAEPLVLAYARRGGSFQIHEAAKAMAIPEPPDTQHDWGRLATRLRRDGHLVPAGFANALRRRTASSLVYTWQGSPALMAGAGVEGVAA
jgi:hypothetical protein